jgi:hypothetical protein
MLIWMYCLKQRLCKNEKPLVATNACSMLSYVIPFPSSINAKSSDADIIHPPEAEAIIFIITIKLMLSGLPGSRSKRCASAGNIR